MDSRGPLIGPVAPPAETTPDACPLPPRRGNRAGPWLLFFLRGGCTQRPDVYTLVTPAISTLSSAVLPCWWCLTGPQPPTNRPANLSLSILSSKRTVEIAVEEQSFRDLHRSDLLPRAFLRPQDFRKYSRNASIVPIFHWNLPETVYPLFNAIDLLRVARNHANFSASDWEF